MIGLLLAQPWALRVAKWAAIVLAVLGVLLAVRNNGRQAERVDNLERALLNVRRRNDVEAAVDRQSSDDTVRELHNDWSRD